MELQVLVVFIPKRRKKKIFGVLRKHLGDVLHELAKQKESRIGKAHLHLDHVHICISIPPKYAVSNVVGYIKGKSAISIARNFTGRRRNFTGENFWARGYFVSTVGLDEEVVKKYIHDREKEDDVWISSALTLKIRPLQRTYKLASLGG
jgi:putative transposase